MEKSNVLLRLRNRMSKFCAFFLLMLGIIMDGCVVIHPKGAGIIDGKELQSEHVQKSQISEVKLRLERSGERDAKFSITCSGQFDIERKFKIKERPGCTKSIAVGFFPGFWYRVGRGDFKDYCRAIAVELLVCPLENCCTFFIPTICTMSILFTQKDYQNGSLTDDGLVGCSRYRGDRTWFSSINNVEQEIAKANIYNVGGFSVFVNDGRYECPEGQREVVVTVPSEAHAATVRIVSAPKFKGELGRYVDSLVGQEFVLPIE